MNVAKKLEKEEKKKPPDPFKGDITYTLHWCILVLGVDFRGEGGGGAPQDFITRF